MASISAHRVALSCQFISPLQPFLHPLTLVNNRPFSFSFVLFPIEKYLGIPPPKIFSRRRQHQDFLGITKGSIDYLLKFLSQSRAFSMSSFGVVFPIPVWWFNCGEISSSESGFTPLSVKSGKITLCQQRSVKKSKVKVLVAHSCPALCDPVDCSRPGSSVHGILQARILE